MFLHYLASLIPGFPGFILMHAGCAFDTTVCGCRRFFANKESKLLRIVMSSLACCLKNYMTLIKTLHSIQRKVRLIHVYPLHNLYR